jgi:hypothetical protein
MQLSRNGAGLVISKRNLVGVLGLAVSALVGGPAVAAIPASERQALLDLYSSAGGANWIYSLSWNGPAGSECGTTANPSPWFGVTCDGANAHVIGINLSENYLVGTLPASLSKLTELQSFNVSDNNYCGGNDSGCSLGGTIPSLSALTQLQGFSIEGNQFSGSIPSLAGLVNLQGFDVSGNNLTGTIPSLAGLASLQGFNAGGNQLSGSIPSLAGLANLQVFDVHGNQLTGAIPALGSLENLQAFYAFGNQLGGSIPSLTGLSALQFFNIANNRLTGSIPSLAGLASLMNFDVDSNQLTGAIPDIAGLGALSAIDVGGNLLTGNVPAPPATLAANGSVLCGNALTATPDANWDAATGVTPWYAACPQAVSSINIDQFGLTGSWFQPSTGGQGLVIEVYPDNAGPGAGTLAAGWYTYDDSTSGQQRWYALQGNSAANGGNYPLLIANGLGGNFDAPPVVGANVVGSATLLFASCTDALLTYDFSDGSGRRGTIPMIRIDANVACTAQGAKPAPSDFLLSGAWFSAATGGQGFYFDINPLQNLLFAGWYTYLPNGAQIGGAASESWFTLQTAAFVPGTKVLDGIGIYSTSGGAFNVGGGVSTQQVGTAKVTYTSCSAMTLSYTFTAGANQGLTGTIDLQTVGPVPEGCSL